MRIKELIDDERRKYKLLIEYCKLKRILESAPLIVREWGKYGHNQAIHNNTKMLLAQYRTTQERLAEIIDEVDRILDESN